MLCPFKSDEESEPNLLKYQNKAYATKMSHYKPKALRTKIRQNKLLFSWKIESQLFKKENTNQIYFAIPKWCILNKALQTKYIMKF